MFKNRKKVSFNYASEASYVYIWNGQKFIKNAKNSQFDEFFKSLLSNSVTRQVNFDQTKIIGKCQITNIKCDFFRDF